jgi:hypothetical protein
MKNYDHWKNFAKTGKIDDYLNYLACTKVEYAEEGVQAEDIPMKSMGKNKEGGIIAGINYSDRDGSISHAGW